MLQATKVVNLLLGNKTNLDKDEIEFENIEIILLKTYTVGSKCPYFRENSPEVFLKYFNSL